jgi:hypothetical protein
MEITKRIAFIQHTSTLPGIVVFGMSCFVETVPRRSASATVHSLTEARLAHRLKNYRERLNKVLTGNKRAVGRLYVSGLLFTKEGSRAGRDLLLAHQHLLRAVTLFDRLSHEGDIPAPRRESEVDQIFVELDLLLQRTGELTARTGEVLAQLKHD